MLRGGTGVLCWPCKGCSHFQDPQWTQPPTHQLLPGTGTPRRSRPPAQHLALSVPMCPPPPGGPSCSRAGRGPVGVEEVGVCVCIFFFLKGFFFFFFKAKTRSKGISTSSNRDHLVH